MPAGRPTIYSQEHLDLAEDYLARYKELDDKIPQIAGLALHIGVARETVYDWAKQEDKKEFSDIVRRILSSQEKALINGGLGQDFNASITKLMLVKHGYHDKQEVDVKDTTPPTPEKRKGRIETLLNKCKS